MSPFETIIVVALGVTWAFSAFWAFGMAVAAADAEGRPQRPIRTLLNCLVGGPIALFTIVAANMILSLKRIEEQTARAEDE